MSHIQRILFLLQSTFAARLLFHSELKQHLRVIDLAMSLSTVDSMSPSTASLMVWRYGSEQLQEFARRVISHNNSSDEPNFIFSPIFTSRILKLPKQKIFFQANKAKKNKMICA